MKASNFNLFHEDIHVKRHENSYGLCEIKLISHLKKRSLFTAFYLRSLLLDYLGSPFTDPEQGDAKVDKKRSVVGDNKKAVQK